MKIDTYRIINAETIQQRIDGLKEEILISESQGDKIRAAIETSEMKAYEETLSNSKPLEEELSKAIESSIQSFESNAYEVPERIEEIKQDYINNLKLDI